MNIETLKVFRDLYDTGSFSKTAEMNYVSQSAVSQQIKKLELVLRCRLFNRAANKLVLTACGEKFYEVSKKVVLLYETSLSEIKQLAVVKTAGEIKISTIYSAGPYLVQDYIKKFMADNPDTKISLEYRQFSQVYADVSCGRADFGFLACPYKKISGLSMVPIAQDDMVVIAGLASPLCAKKSLAVKDLDGLDFIFFDKAFPSRRYIDSFFKKQGVKVNIRMELDNVDTIKTAVSSGVGVSILPGSTVREGENGGKLHVMKFSDAKISRPLYLLYSKNKKLSPAARRFMEMLVKWSGAGQ
ncbi:MAG: LysR family transcriptional regulator [Elusimicrobia bacterium]|nr:LysR family transcriptional regulator [Elusimicrobiota bacterium]